MQRQFEDTIKKYNMLPDDCGVVVAVSGGADSVALLSLLCGYAGITKDRLLVVHVEHGIRGEDSLRDAKYVQKLCSEYGITCHIHHIKVMDEVEKTGETVEETARRIRYDILKNEADELEKKQNCVVKIAVAHHLYDQAETVIMNLVRGAHLKGLGGMQPVNGRIIRPLINSKKEEIIKYLKEKGIDWCSDCTNYDTDYTRNLIRHEILPLLEKINARAMEHIASTAGELREIEDYLTAESDILYEKYVIEKEHEKNVDVNRLLIKNELLDETTSEYVNRVIYKAISTVAGRAKDITGEHIASVRELFDKQVGKSVNLPYKLWARRDYEGVSLKIHEETEGDNLEKRTDEFLVFSKDKCLSVNEKRDLCGYQITLLDANVVSEIEKKEYTKYFDYDIISAMVLRTPREGDYITIDADGHTKTLHKYLKDEKVSYEDREQIAVFADGNHIIWVKGYRISEAYRVTSKTKRILKIEFRG